MNLFIAYLRRPYGRDDPRDDPFYLDGSFGLTGCHGKNLLNPGTTKVRKGDRVCFAQPGTRGTRIVHITPPIEILKRRVVVEIRWQPSRPLKYEQGLPLTVELASWFNPRSGDDDASIWSHLRTFSSPAIHPEKILARYQEWVSSKDSSAFAAMDRETLDPVDQRLMRPLAYGKRGHAGSKVNKL